MIRYGGRSGVICFLLLTLARRASSQSSSLLYTRSKAWLAWVAELIALCGHKRLFSNIFPLLLSSITTHNPITERLSIDKYWMEWQSGEVGICNLGYRWIKFGLLLLFVFDYIFNSHNYFSCQSNGFLHIVGSLLKSWMWVNPELCSPSFEWQYNACWYFQPRFSSLIVVYWSFWLER